MNFDKNKLTERFNETGFPFQYWCLETIRNLHTTQNGREYRAISEHPFTFPPSNGPLLGVSSVIDIIAITKSKQSAGDTLLFLIIECKRASSKIKNWIFISDKKYQEPTFLFSDAQEDGTEKFSGPIPMVFPNLGYSIEDEYDYCKQCIEINDQLTTINQNQKEKIYEALKQVNHGIVAFQNQQPKSKIRELQRTKLFNTPKFRCFVYLPIIVTTASLFVSRFDYLRVKSGDIQPTDTEYTQKDWLTYEFPLPDFISYTAEREKVIINKRTTFIVNNRAFVRFLNEVADFSFN